MVNRDVYINLTHSCGGLLEPKGSTLTPWKSAFNAGYSNAGCPGLYRMFRCNSVLKCVSQPEIEKKPLKTSIFGVQGRSRSSMLVPLESSSSVLVMISSKSVSVCHRSHARRANSGKITISKGSTPT